MVNFNCSKEDADLILSIVRKYNDMRQSNGFNPIDEVNLSMSITACHCNGCELRLQEMLDSDSFNLAHDVVGIDQNIPRSTGRIKNGFLPRFAS